MMFNACLFEIISYLTLRSSRVGSGIAQRREGHLSFAVSHKRCYVWCCAGHIEVYRSGIFQLHSIVDFSFSCWIERDFWYLSRIGLPTNLEIGSGAPGRPLQQGPSSEIFEDKDKEVNSVWKWVKHQAGTPPLLFQRSLQAWFRVLIRQQTVWTSGRARLNFF